MPFRIKLARVPALPCQCAGNGHTRQFLCAINLILPCLTPVIKTPINPKF